MDPVEELERSSVEFVSDDMLERPAFDHDGEPLIPDDWDDETA